MSSPYDLEAMARLGRKCLSCAELETECTRLRTLLTHQEQQIRALAAACVTVDNGYTRCALCRRLRDMHDWTDADHDSKCPVLAALQQAPR
jgi:hypothetical protein